MVQNSNSPSNTSVYFPADIWKKIDELYKKAPKGVSRNKVIVDLVRKGLETNK